MQTRTGGRPAVGSGAQVRRIYSNGRAKREGWQPLAPSTFDGGVILAGEDGFYFRFWFHDEDSTGKYWHACWHEAEKFHTFAAESGNL